MSMTDSFDGNRYEIVAWARNQKPVYYHEFGGYTGEWLLVATNEAETYHLYKGWYGSCSGCDAYEDMFDSSPTKDEAVKFATDYPSFIEVPLSTMRNLVESGRLATIFPANVREFDDVSVADVARDVAAAFKVRHDMPFSAAEIVALTNQEIKQQALKAFGYERFVAEIGARTIHEEASDRLIAIGEDVVFLDLKDSST